MYHPHFWGMWVQDDSVIFLQCKHGGSDLVAFDAKVSCKRVAGWRITMLHQMMYDDPMERDFVKCAPSHWIRDLLRFTSKLSDSVSTSLA